MGHTTRILQTNLASLAFAALAGGTALPSMAQDKPLPPLPAGRLYPEVKPENMRACYPAITARPGRCPEPFNRHVPDQWMWLENESGGLKPGPYNLVYHNGQCYPITDVQSIGKPLDELKGRPFVKNCFPLERLPDGYVAPPLPAGAKTIQQTNAENEQRQAKQDAEQAEIKRRREALANAPVIQPSVNAQWWSQPNFLPSIVDPNQLAVSLKEEWLGIGQMNRTCHFSNGLVAETASAVFFDNRMLWFVREKDCKLLPLIELSDGKTRPTAYQSLTPFMEAAAKSPVAYALFKIAHISTLPKQPLSGNIIANATAYQNAGVVFPKLSGLAIGGGKSTTATPIDQPVLLTQEKPCPLPDGLTGKPGEGYIPKDASGFYIIKDDCSRELKVKPLEVKLYKSKSGLNYGIFPNNEVAVETSEVTVTDKLDIDGGSTFALMGLLDSTPTAKANQLLIDNAAKLASQSAARQAVRMGASESAVGLAAALEASGAPILAQIVTKSWQGAAAFGAGYAIGYAGTYGYYAVKEVFNPKALPNPIEEMLKDVDNRPDDPTSSINQCKGQKLVQFNKFVPEKIRNVDLYRALDYVQGKACSEPYTCTDRKLYEASQSEIFQRLRNGTACYESRKNVNIQCFAGGDSKHKDKEREVLRSMQKCRDKLMVTP